MARLIFPEDLVQQRELLKNIKAKHEADGANSVLKTLLAEKNIDLDADTTAGDKAAQYDASQQLLSKQSENYTQQRNLLFDPVFSHLRGGVQFLKSLFKPKVQQLGEWGITVDNGKRIVYPPDFAGRVKNFTDFKTKHDSYPAGTSPLENYLTEQKISLANDLTDANDSVTNEANAQQSRKDSETATQDRNKVWDPVIGHLKAIGDYLMKLFAGKEKTAGDWGFTIDDSPRAPKFRISTVKIGSQITVNGVVIGSTLTNTGTTDIHIYKGKTTTGTPAIVAAGQMLGMTKGYSMITAVNPSTTVTAKFKVLSIK